MGFFFLACTPRTGNVWFRRLLAGALRGTHLSAHQPDEIDWYGLQPPCIVAMHWHRLPAFREFLAARQFDVIVMLRHPLDVLISILHFCQQEPATAKWLGGEGGTEASLLGANPAGPEFLQYALSRRAHALLGISAEWYSHARAVVRYEELVMETEETLMRTLASLGQEPIESLTEVVRSNSLERLRPYGEHHFWRGEPGLWRRLIIPEFRRQIYERHRELFQLWGYDVAEDGDLSLSEARSNWSTVCKPGARRGE
ncbi:MAG: hypothetical protein ABJF23_09035 [Bryobacteraceae bacterium]